MKRAIATLLILTMTGMAAFAATPFQANPNALLTTGVDSSTGNATAPYVDHSTGAITVLGTVGVSGIVPVSAPVALPVTPQVAGSAVSAANPMPVQQTAIPTAPPYLQLDAIATGVYPGKTPFAVDGKANSVNNTRVDVIEFGTAYTPPASPIQMQVVSSSANDAALGSGVRTVLIHYLDNNYNVQTTTVTLNGVTPVLTTPTNILRVNGFHAVTTAGITAMAAGNISLQSVGGGTTYSYITAGYNSSRNSVFTIPAGKTGYIYDWGIAAGTSTGTHFTSLTLTATSHDGTAYPNVFQMLHESSVVNAPFHVPFFIPIKVPATMDIKVKAVSDASNANVTVTTYFDGWYE